MIELKTSESFGSCVIDCAKAVLTDLVFKFCKGERIDLYTLACGDLGVWA